MTVALANEPDTVRVREVIEDLETIFDDLRPLQQEFARALRLSSNPTIETLASLRPSIMHMLDLHRGLVAGSGVITAPDILSDRPRWLEWWWTNSIGSVKPLRVNLDQHSPEFFDYTAAEWYSVPIRESRRYAAGPYVDYFCSNKYTMTFAVPVHLGETPVGVAAADILVSVLEQRLMPILRHVGAGAVLTNARGRVIASGSDRHAPGDLLNIDPARATSLQSSRIGSDSAPGIPCWLITE